MTADLFTKNLSGPLFEKHASEYVGKDKYYKERKKRKKDDEKVWEDRMKNQEETAFQSISGNSEYYRIWKTIMYDDS